MSSNPTTPENPIGSREQHNMFVCKVIQDNEDIPKSSKQWTRAKRCNLLIDERGVSFTDKIILFSEIEKATLRVYKSALFLEYGILSLTSKGATHHFGIKYSDYWKGKLPFDLEIIHEETPYLFYRQLLIIIILVYLFWEFIKH